MRFAANSRRAFTIAGLFVLGATTIAFAQLGGAGAQKPAPTVMEHSQQEVQANLLVQTLNDMSKQRWEVFQITPVWTIRNLNGETELVPKAYEVFGRRPVEGVK